jgi:DNA helicase IV
MPQFRFNTISRADIERSQGGNTMIQAIDYDGNDNQLVTGVPGSGKTTITIMRAERLINLNKRIKVFTYQTLLRTALNNIATPALQQHIFGFYDWFVRVKRFGYLQSHYTELEMSTLMVAEPIIDEILIDEGQDFEERIFRSLLPKCRQMTVGADNAQKVHERGILAAAIRQELDRTKATIPIRLEYNYRNTFELYNFARFFMPDNERANNPISLRLMPRGNGNLPVVIQVLSDDEKFNRLRVILENAGDRNIAVLLYHQAEVDSYSSKIQEMGFSCTKHHNRAQAGGNIENILVTTYKSAKGLEFQVVVMPDMHTAMDSEEKTAEHYYVGCTRAKESLFLTFTGLNLPDYFEAFGKDSYEFRPAENRTQRNTTQDISMTDLPF